MRCKSGKGGEQRCNDCSGKMGGGESIMNVPLSSIAAVLSAEGNPFSKMQATAQVKLDKTHGSNKQVVVQHAHPHAVYGYSMNGKRGWNERACSFYE